MTLKLYPYQEKMVDAMLSMPSGKPHFLNADDVGTGKTPTSIEAAKRAGCTSGIILCTASIKEQWQRQALAWELCAEDEIQVLYGLDARVTSAPWVVLNYALVREKAIREQLYARSWHCIIEDEVQNLKTHESLQTKAVFHRSYGIANKCYYKWPMSGTLMPNRPLELYPVLRTHFPEVIKGYERREDYMRHFCGGFAANGRGASNVAELTERLQPIMLRREQKDVWRDMPPVVTTEVFLDVPYQNHPEYVGDDFMPESTLRRVIAEAKAPYTAAYIADKLESGVAKIAVFTYHRAVLEHLEKALAKYQPVKIYGGITANKRELSLQKFTANPDCRLSLLQIASAGEGLDGLQHVCNYYIRAEPEWCPGREDQAGGRILRLGQLRTVFEDKLIAAGSYEDVIARSADRKRSVIDVVLKPNGGNFCMSIEQNIASLAADVKALTQAFQQVASQMGNGAAPVAAAPPIAAPTATPTPPAPVVPVSAPAPVPAAAPPPVPQVPAGISRKAFEDKVAEICNPYGANALPVLKEVKAALGFAEISTGELPDNVLQSFVDALSQRLPKPAA